MSENYIKDGLFLEEVGFFDDGSLARYHGTFEYYNELVYWYAGGSLKKVEVKDKIYKADFDFDERGRLQSALLSGGGDVFSYIRGLKSILKFPQFDSEEFFGQIYASDRLALGGEGLNDKLFYQLVSSNGFYDTKKFNFFKT